MYIPAGGKRLRDRSAAEPTALQEARKELIRTVYGSEPAVYGIDSISFADFLHASGFRCRKTIARAEKVFAALTEQMAAGTPLTDEQTQLYTGVYIAYEDAADAADALDRFMITYCDGMPRENRDEQKQLRDKVSTAQRDCKKATAALGKTLGFKDPDYRWAVRPTFCKDIDINEMYVDFN